MSSQYWRQIQYILSFWDSRLNLLLDIHFEAPCILFYVKHQKPAIIYDDNDTSALMLKWLELFASSQFYHSPVPIHTKWWHSYVAGAQLFKTSQAKILYACSNSQPWQRYLILAQVKIVDGRRAILAGVGKSVVISFLPHPFFIVLLYLVLLHYCIIVLL